MPPLVLYLIHAQINGGRGGIGKKIILDAYLA